MSEDYDAKREIEKICEEHKIIFTRNDKGKLILYEDLESAGLLSLVHNELLKFIEKKKIKGFQILIVKDGEKEYPIELCYDGGIEEKKDPNEFRFYCVSCGARFNKKPLKCSCGGKNIQEDYKQYSKKEIKEDLKKFNDPNLLELIKEEISKDHLEDDTLKITNFLVCVSSLLEDPRLRMSIQLTGGTSEGKDNLMKSCLKHIPEEAYLFLTSGTQATLEDDIKEKRLICFSEINLFKEGGANKYLLEVIKQITEGGTSALKKDLRFNSKQSRHEEGDQKSVIFGTTDIEQDEEAGTRFLKGSVKATPQRIKIVNENTFDNFSNEENLLKKLNKSPSWIRKVLSYFLHKEKYLIVIPYAKYLKEKIDEKDIFDYSDPRSQRDIKRLLALTCATTWLYQKQRTIKEYAGYKFLVSEPQDLINTLKYSNEFFNQTYTGFDERLNYVIKFIDEYPNAWVDKKLIQDHLNVTKNTINLYCRTLSQEGVLEGCKGSILNEQEGVKIYDGNRIYYQRVRKEFKKSLIRVEIKDLQEFLDQKKGSNLIEYKKDILKNKEFSKENKEINISNGKIEPFKLNPLDQFSEEEIVKAGYTREQLEELTK